MLFLADFYLKYNLISTYDRNDWLSNAPVSILYVSHKLSIRYFTLSDKILCLLDN